VVILFYLSSFALSSYLLPGYLSPQPGKLLLGAMRSADDTQEKFFERELLTRHARSIARSGGLVGFHPGAQFLERPLSYEPPW